MLTATPPALKLRFGKLHGSSDALALARLAEARSPVAIVCASALDAQRLREEIPWFAPTLRVSLFPDWETLPYDTFSPHHDLISERLETLYRITTGDCDVTIVPATTALQRLPPPAYLAAYTFFIEQGTRLDASRLRVQLATAGYSHVTQVVAPGEYCVRGGLIDLFPMGSALPYRIELADDDDRIDPHVRRRHPAHALQGPRDPPPAGARVPARRHRANAVPGAVPGGVRGRCIQVAGLQGRLERHRSRGHRVLPSALL